MTGETTLKEVISRLGKAIEGLENAVAAKLEHERDYSEAETIPKRAPNGWKMPTRKCRAGW